MNSFVLSYEPLHLWIFVEAFSCLCHTPFGCCYDRSSLGLEMTKASVGQCHHT